MIHLPVEHKAALTKKQEWTEEQFIRAIRKLQEPGQSDADFAKETLGVNPQDFVNWKAGRSISGKKLLRIVQSAIAKTGVDVLAPLRGDRPIPTDAERFLVQVAAVVDAARSAGVLPHPDAATRTNDPSAGVGIQDSHQQLAESLPAEAAGRRAKSKAARKRRRGQR